MSKLILVVEDQADNRQILRDLLGNAGYDLVEAEDGEQALAAIAKQRPDLILMDIQLSAMDGYEATRRIRANPDAKSIPIIAVTSYALAGDEAKRLPPAAMPTSQNLTARAHCSRRCVNIWPSRNQIPWRKLACWVNLRIGRVALDVRLPPILLQKSKIAG
jgi:two-component system, cell cycle response regulator DivK